MKKKLLLSIMLQTAVVISVVAQTNVLHLNLGSHNEIDDPAYGVNYKPGHLFRCVNPSLNATHWFVQQH